MTSRNDPALRALVGSVLWPGFNGYVAPDWLKSALDEGLAGVVYFGQNIDGDDAEQPARLSSELRSIRSGVLIGVDEEGGNVSRLEAARGSTLPGHAQLGRRGDVALTREVGVELGRRLAAAGANVALAPVADVNTNAQNPVIGVRAFGDSADLVSPHVAAMVAGLQSNGVAACVKHFPGHGDTHTDSHHSLPRLDLTWQQIERDHLPPFHAAIAAGVLAVMTAHIVVPEFGELPATLNPALLARLRSAGFTGTIVTDALDMAAIRSTVGAGPGAVQAILAGADLLCIGNPANLGPKAGATSDLDDFLEVQNALFDALDDGSLPVAALERASVSVATLLLPAPAVDPADAASSGAVAGVAGVGPRAPREFTALSRDLCAVTGPLPVIGETLTVLDLRNRATIAVASTVDVFSTALRERFDVTRISHGGLAARTADGAAPLAAQLSALLERVPGTSGLIVLVDAIAGAGLQRDALAVVATSRPDALVVNAGLAATEPLPLTAIECLSASRLSAETVRELVLQASERGTRTTAEEEAPLALADDRSGA
ncbi:glycoside hydrolase family 3 N-terminal domain-containing protein [Leifsonia sp. YAF41]|uniref:glycoside hydrolase family 3 N-terminal domain-containing protein n=1 Tax=Leifsonia sp. YAF41 TaxID=3233086 RepID=UPI003F97C8FF